MWCKVSAQRIKGTLGINRLIKLESSYRIAWFGTSIVGSSHPEEKGPPRVGLFGPLKRNVELGLERRETVRSLSTVFFLEILFLLLLVRENELALSSLFSMLVSHATLGSGFQFLGLISLCCLAIKYNLISEIY